MPLNGSLEHFTTVTLVWILPPMMALVECVSILSEEKIISNNMPNVFDMKIVIQTQSKENHKKTKGSCWG